jgi:hypothetical protein
MSEPLSKLKLQLIQAILRTDDPEVLRTVLQVLSLENPAATTASADRLTSLDNLPDMLNQGAAPTDPEVQDLQRDIDEVFNA